MASIFHQYLYFLSGTLRVTAIFTVVALIRSPWMGQRPVINAKFYIMMLGLVAAVVLPLPPSLSFVHGQLNREVEMDYQSCQM